MYQNVPSASVLCRGCRLLDFFFPNQEVKRNQLQKNITKKGKTQNIFAAFRNYIKPSLVK